MGSTGKWSCLRENPRGVYVELHSSYEYLGSRKALGCNKICTYCNEYVSTVRVLCVLMNFISLVSC